MITKLRLSSSSRASLIAVMLLACGSLGDSTQFGGPRYARLEQAPVTTPEESRTARESHVIKTVFLLMFENNNWSDIKGNPAAPYFNSLLSLGAHTENYFENDSAIHPSEPNYIWLEAGDNLGIADDNAPALNHRSTTKHLTSLLEAAGISWKAYEENISGSSCPLLPDGLYDPKHDPMLYFDDLTDDLSPTSAHCISHQRPFSELAADLVSGSVASYNFITPNLCDDMHNTSGCENQDSISNGDQWLSRELP